MATLHSQNLKTCRTGISDRCCSGGDLCSQSKICREWAQVVRYEGTIGGIVPTPLLFSATSPEVLGTPELRKRQSLEHSSLFSRHVVVFPT